MAGDDVDPDGTARLAARPAAALASGARPSVMAFAVLMEAKLRANDRKPHWGDQPVGYLAERLVQEAQELLAALKQWRAAVGAYEETGAAPVARAVDAVRLECADVANFAMMIADNVGALGVTGARGQREDERGR
jgi:NTP pyrophosphatase (non-canonical NTP hydrolase)